MGTSAQVVETEYKDTRHGPLPCVPKTRLASVLVPKDMVVPCLGAKDMAWCAKDMVLPCLGAKDMAWCAKDMVLPCLGAKDMVWACQRHGCTVPWCQVPCLCVPKTLKDMVWRVLVPKDMVWLGLACQRHGWLGLGVPKTRLARSGRAKDTVLPCHGAKYRVFVCQSL
jgi:hypothetical protein